MKRNIKTKKDNKMNGQVVINPALMDPALLRRAAELSEQIQGLQSELNQMLSGHAIVDTPRAQSSYHPVIRATTATGKRRNFTPESIARIQAAQRKRWRNVRKAKAEAEAALTTVPAQPASVAPAPVAPAPAVPAATPPVSVAPAAPVAETKNRSKKHTATPAPAPVAAAA